MTPCCRRPEHLSAIIGMLSAIDRNTVRLQSESVAAFVGIRKLNVHLLASIPKGI
jgi:hypothetical protein